ncbi:MAG: FAD-dependent oxidoreductase [Candidatus Omnitrophica bacterium]|nr:FAD-dependent oxidoreductase [Candidatus Omnitrophota bacterium]
MKYDYDLIILGGGAAGLFAASVANTLGAKTAIIEKNKLGGDCTWYGCIPSKVLIKSAEVAHNLCCPDQFGLSLSGDCQMKLDSVMGHVQDVISEIATHHRPEDLRKRGIEVIFGDPKFFDKDTIEVKEKKLRAKKYIICTGTHPLVPPIEGLSDIDYLTNETIFDLEKLPESLVVLGGGPIGIELSQSLQRLGVKVTIVEMLDRIIAKEDQEIADVLERKIKSEGIKLLTSKKAVKFEKEVDKVKVTIEDKEKNKSGIEADKVLVATGRAPNIKSLALERANVEYDKKSVKVNNFLQTSNPNIFAAGDIAGPYMFSHVAAYQASVSVRNAMFRKIAWQRVDYNNITWATFTEPEVAHLGLTEEEARQKHKQIKIYKSDYTKSDRAITDSEKEGLVKIICDKKDHIVGAHIAGAQAGEIMQGLLIAKSQKIPLAKLAQTMFIYPTLSELVKKTAAQSLIEKMDNPLIKWVLKIMKKV